MSNTPEGKVKAKVRDIFKKHDVYYLHIPGSQFGKGGAPDYVCCVMGRFLAVECKAGKNTQTELQREEQEKIENAKGIYVIINESNLDTLEFAIEALQKQHFLFIANDRP